MFDVKLLDGLNFGDLGKMLDRVLEKIDEIKEECAGDEDDSRFDMLLVIGNQIIVRMDAILRDYDQPVPELRDQWTRVTESYKESFNKYKNTYLKEGVPIAMVKPESPSQASDAAWRAKLDEFVLDEKLLEGMNAGDLFEVNRFITEKVKWFDEEFPEDVAEPIIEKLLNFGGLVIRRLDPLVREAYADNPEKLAQWEAVLRGPADPEGEGDGPVDIESSQVS